MSAVHRSVLGNPTRLVTGVTADSVIANKGRGRGSPQFDKLWFLLQAEHA